MRLHRFCHSHDLSDAANALHLYGQRTDLSMFYKKYRFVLVNKKPPDGGFFLLSVVAFD